MARITMLTAVLAAGLAMATAWPSAQTATRKVLTVEDSTRWRTIGGETISPDGRWVAYVLQSANTPSADAKPMLHLLNLDTNTDVEVANATGPRFSDDSNWLAYQVDPGGGRGRGGRGQDVGPPAADPPASGDEEDAEPRRAELRRLATGDVRSWQDIQSFEFNSTATHLALRRRPPSPPAGGRAGGAPDPNRPRGVDVVLHDLTTGRDQLLGSVGDSAFNDTGDLLGYTVDAAVKDANGLFVLDLVAGRLTPLDNDAKRYTRLTWNDEGTALAVLKGLEVEKMRERANVLLAFRRVHDALGRATGSTAETDPVVLDPATAAGFPPAWVVSDRAALAWSDDGERVFFGAKPQEPAPPASRRRDPDKDADVDVWNTADDRIQSVQMRRAEADQNFTFRQAFDVARGSFVKLTDESMRDLDVAPDGRWAVGRDARAYVKDYGPAAADFYRVNTSTGERTRMLTGQLTGSHVFGISPDGRHFLYWKDDQFQAWDLDAGASRALGGDGRTSFVDQEFDRPGPKPAYGISAYAKDGTAVLVEHRYDTWLLPLDGSAPSNLTNGAGAKDEIRFRYVRTEPDDDAPGGGGRGGRGGGARQTVDLSKPLTFSAYGEYTKKSGFYRLAGGRLTPLVYEDASYGTPERAKDADRFLLTRQTFREFPDLRVSGPDFSDARKITDANPQQSEYRWGRRVLFDFENKDGVRLQGILALPDDYQAGERRPMLVTFYEKNSQNLNRYSAPSYLTGMGSSPIQAVSEGYITMLPDIHFRTGASHSDMLECVEAAVKKVIELGYADPARIGVSGHSYGGEGAAFIGTRSKLFAAVGMGAGVTDLFQDFSQNWGWSYNFDGGSGANGSDYYLFGQGREAVSPWDDPELYMFESALTHAPEATAPFLIMHGTDDPTVAFQNGLGFYNALRFNGKQAILLAYPGEGHGLRGLANRKDLTKRFFEFFNHYLKGEPAPAWMTEGVPFLKKKDAGGRLPGS
jgi:dipeptidyl aminopeptidase/acylaminoacyl peptidase